MRTNPFAAARSAIAAVFLLFLLAGRLPANAIRFVIVSYPNAQSYLKIESTIFGAGVGINASVPQFAGSDTMRLYGDIWADVIQKTSIQLQSGSNIYANLGAAGVGGVPGSFVPFDPVISPPNWMSPGVNPNSNIGLEIPALGLKTVYYDLKLDFGNAFTPSTPVGLSATSFNLAGQGMEFIAGRQATVSLLLGNPIGTLGSESISLRQSPAAFFGTNGADIGTWDLFDLTAGPFGTLRIPIHSQFTFNLTTEFGGIDQTVFITGQILATPVLDPEPSSMTLAALGLIGLLRFCWARRKKRAR